MSSIITITFNPCIDKSTTIHSIVPEKKLRCAPPKFEPGGGGVNVARAIKKLGGEALALYPSGGHTGKFLDVLLENEGIPALVVETANRTRENFIVLDTSNNQQYRFGMPGPEISEEEWRKCLQLLEEARDMQYVVTSGSLPPGVPPEVMAEIAGIVKKKNAKLIVDTSGEALRQAAKGGAYLLKPNLGELSALVGKEELKPEEIRASAEQLIADGKTEIVVVSMGAYGAMLISGNECIQIAPPPVRRLSTVGAGDSMVAGIVLSLSRGKNLKEVLQFGIACGTAATINPGTQLCKLEDVEKLLALIKGQEQGLGLVQATNKQPS